MLGLLLVAIGAYFYFTSSVRVKRLAEDYLTNLTGRTVRIDRARFSPSEGIWLRGLRVYPPDEEPDKNDANALFKADEVRLDLAPGSLMAGRLKVRSIVAVHPVIQRIQDVGARAPKHARQERPKHAWTTKLPPIELREGRFSWIVRMAGQPPIETYKTELTATLTPDPTLADVYQISGQAGQAAGKLVPISGTVWMNPFRCETSVIVVDSLQQLPVEVQAILARYHISFAKVKIRGGFDAKAGELTVPLDCLGTDLTLPLDDLTGGGATSRPADRPPVALKFADVRGRITLKVRNQPPDRPGESPPGQIVFGDLDEKGRRRPLTGTLNGQPFELFGRYDGFSARAPFELDLTVSRLEIPRDPALLARLPERARDMLEYYSPSGALAVRIHAARARREGPVLVSGRLDPLDLTATYWRYPYRLDRVTGTIEFDNKKVQLNVQGQRGRGLVTVKGAVGLGPHRPLDLVVCGRQFPVNADSLAALAPKHATLLAQLNDLKVDGGEVDFTVTVRRADLPDASAESTVVLDRVAGVNLRFEEFPYPIRIMAGRIERAESGVKLRDIEAVPQHLLRRAATTRPGSQPDMDTANLLLMEGSIGRDDNGRAEVDLKVMTAVSLPLDETLWRAFPPDVTSELLKYHIDGRAGLFGRIVKRPGRPIDFDVRAQIKSGYLKADVFPYALDSLTGKVHVTPQRIEFEDAVGQHQAVPIAIKGQIGLKRDQPTRLAFRSDRVPLDDDLKAALQPGAKKAWEQLAPAGQVAIDALLEQPAASQPDRAAATSQPDRPPMTTTVTVTALGNRLCYSEFAYPLANVTGQLVIRPDRVDIVELSDESSGRRVRMTGTLWPDRDNLNLPKGAKPLPLADLKITAANLEFDETLRKAVPWQIRQRWNDVLPAGAFDLQLDKLIYTPLGPAARWDFAGRADVRNAKATFGLSLEKVTGTISGAGSVVTGRAIVLSTKLALSAATVAGRPLTEVEGSLFYDPRNSQLRLEDVKGKLYGGAIRGFAQVKMGEADLPYRLWLAGNNIDLNELVNEGKAPADRLKMAGRLEGEIHLEGQSVLGSRAGAGELILTRGEIYQVPPVLAVFGPDRTKAKNPNQSARMHFFLDGDRVTLDEVNLRDPAVSLLGTGTIDLASKELDLVIVAGDPLSDTKGGARLLEELISGATEALMRYHLTGSLRKPRLETVPLHTLRDAIDELSNARRHYVRKPAASPTRRPPVPNTAPLPPIQPSEPKPESRRP